MINKKFSGNTNLPDYDCVIIGSGPAGFTMALELEKFGKKIIMFEAGDEIYNEKSQELYDNIIAGDNYPSLYKSRLRQLGGSSNHWGGTCRTMEDEDFLNWPIKKADLEPYAQEACEILDIRNNFENFIFSKNIKQIQYQQSNMQFVNKFYDKIKSSKLINIFLNSAVTDLIFEQNIIAGLKINNQFEFKNKSKFYVLGCGGIENTRIMLFIKKKNPEIFLADENIGKFYMDHPYFTVGQALYEKSKLDKAVNKLLMRNYTNQYIFKLNKEYVKNNNILSSSIFINPTEQNDNFKNNFKKFLCKQKNFTEISRLLSKNIICGDYIQMSLEQEPISSNEIKLLETYDEIGMPKFELRWRKPQASISTIIKSLEELGRVFISKNIGRIAIFNEIFDGKIPEHLGGYHHLGGTRIGFNMKDGVVDKNLKCFNVKNLYLIGSSIFRTSSYVNPTLTIVQFALRLSDFINKSLKQT